MRILVLSVRGPHSMGHSLVVLPKLALFHVYLALAVAKQLGEWLYYCLVFLPVNFHGLRWRIFDSSTGFAGASDFVNKHGGVSAADDGGPSSPWITPEIQRNERSRVSSHHKNIIPKDILVKSGRWSILTALSNRQTNDEGEDEDVDRSKRDADNTSLFNDNTVSPKYKLFMVSMTFILSFP